MIFFLFIFLCMYYCYYYYYNNSNFYYCYYYHSFDVLFFSPTFVKTHLFHSRGKIMYVLTDYSEDI